MVDELLDRLREASASGDVEAFASIKHKLLLLGYTVKGHLISGCEHEWKPLPENVVYLKCVKCEALGHLNLHRKAIPIMCRYCSQFAVRWVEGSPNCRSTHH